ncbi:UNVERIFIED_CONTAM: hypothetical protein Sradi_0175000 [Sesamum radiatum]|uniref:CCHC-type domain-containing protein n=1 Tax=Sesamum radiatum TaxID=300843 RepID=A0AAW2W1Q8_SESRA
MDKTLELLGKTLVLKEEEEDELTIPQEAGSDEVDREGSYLVGRVLTSKIYRTEFLQSTIRAAMNPVKGMDVTDIGGGRILLRFNHEIDRNRALEASPWSIDKNILILNEVKGDENPHMVDLNWCAFFVHVHGLPIKRMTKTISVICGNRIGQFLDSDQNSFFESWGASMRIQVAIDVRQPLRRFMKLRTETGEQSTISFTYERLPNFCYSCGTLCHLTRDCLLQYEEGYRKSDTNEQYGAWLREPPRTRSNMIRIRPDGNSSSGSVFRTVAASLRCDGKCGACIFDPTLHGKNHDGTLRREVREDGSSDCFSTMDHGKKARENEVERGNVGTGLVNITDSGEDLVNITPQQHIFNPTNPQPKTSNQTTTKLGRNQ